MATPLLNLQNIHLSLGGTALIAGAELIVAPNERLCLVGRNGSGKSTLLKIAAGLLETDSGDRFVQPGATIRYLPQEPDLEGYNTVLEYVEGGLSPGDAPYRARYCLEQLGLDGSETPGQLSGGEQRRAALARVLAPQPDILLLDEPTNHLDLPAIEWLETELKSLKSAFVLISHDRRFLESLSQETVWLDRGITRRLSQGFSGFEEWRDAVLAQEESDAHKLDRKLVAEADWLRYGVTARRKRNVRRLAQLYALRKKRAELSFAPGKATMTTAHSEISGNLVVEANHISKAYDSRPIVQDFSLRLLRGDRIGLVGANGTGKTTLLKMLIGTLAPDSGVVQLGSNVEMVVIDQKRETLEPDATVIETLTGGSSDMITVGKATKHVVGYMKDFLFSPEQARIPVRLLSGGERNRLLIARALAQPSNLLVLDEPTNDLDLETLDLLQEMVSEYPGTVILVSHDRDFLDKTVSAVLMSEDDGLWREYAGGYTDMLAQRGEGVSQRAKQQYVFEANERNKHTKKGDANTDPSFAQRKKLSFNEQYELRTLPDKIAALEGRITVLNNTLTDPTLYEKDSQLFAKTSEMLAQLEQELAHSEERWLTLEMLQDELQA